MAKRNLIWLIVVAVLIVGLFRLAPMTAEQDSVFQTYAPLIEVDSLVRQRHVEAVEEQQLVNGAVRGMMLTLDPYSGYIAPDELPAYRRRAAGEYVGIGLQLGMVDRQLSVIAPIEQSPAIEAGLQAGDAILAIDGAPTDGLGVADADRLLSGNPGSAVELTIRRAAGGEPETLRVTRAPVSVPSVKGCRRLEHGEWDYLVDPDSLIAYVRVSNFHDNTTEEFDRALDRIHGLGPGGLVLDLRANPGGSLAAAVAMVDRFLSSGVIVATVTRHQAVDTYRARPEGTVPLWPMAVIIDGGSASASEIVAGSLQDHDRAVIVGTRSFGKGVVQNVVMLSRLPAAVCLTVAHYRLPNGRIIHKTPANRATDEWGVIPDRIVEIDSDEAAAIQEQRGLVDRTPFGPTTRASAQDHPPTILRDSQLSAALEEVRRMIASGRQDPDVHRN